MKERMRSNYYEVDELKDIYLEDSYVLGIDETSSTMTFYMDFVINEDHHSYHSPKNNEQYCYMKGKIVFENITRVNWKKKANVTYIDANGEKDIGNLDFFRRKDTSYLLFGDWGEVEIKAEGLKIIIDCSD